MRVAKRTRDAMNTAFRKRFKVDLLKGTAFMYVQPAIARNLMEQVMNDSAAQE
jgi:hypothetical protein